MRLLAEPAGGQQQALYGLVLHGLAPRVGWGRGAADVLPVLPVLCAGRDIDADGRGPGGDDGYRAVVELRHERRLYVLQLRAGGRGHHWDVYDVQQKHGQVLGADHATAAAAGPAAEPTEPTEPTA